MKADPQAGSQLLDEAEDFAVAAHGDQLRNYTGRLYIEHPRDVADLVRKAGLGEDAVAAALLHDTVEDTGATVAEIRERFGDRVGGLVETLTEDPAIEPYEARKDAHRERVLAAGAPATAIYAADKLSNLRDLRDLYGAEGERVAERFKAPLDVRIALWERDFESLRRVEPRLPFADELGEELVAIRAARQVTEAR